MTVSEDIVVSEESAETITGEDSVEVTDVNVEEVVEVAEESGAKVDVSAEIVGAKDEVEDSVETITGEESVEVVVKPEETVELAE